MSASKTVAEGSAWSWFWRGSRGTVSLPTTILVASFVGFGVLCRETGISLAHAVFMTAAIWALPSQVVLVGAIASGASIFGAGLAVTLSAVRLAPMVAAWVPLVKGAATPRWQLLVLSHFVAVTAWIFSLMRLPRLPREARLPYFAGFAVTLTITNILVTAVSYTLAAALPPLLAGGLLFLTPIYFLTAMTAASRLSAERLAMLLGLLLGPIFHVYGVRLGLVWSGLIGGVLAFAIHTVLRKRRP